MIELTTESCKKKTSLLRNQYKFTTGQTLRITTQAIQNIAGNGQSPSGMEEDYMGNQVQNALSCLRIRRVGAGREEEEENEEEEEE